mmetsp:Transcript_6249/g.11113  ORF Transcript_6249/g.11113 Transcript_6249/m.11113 type:complete len:127 (-) Transcript_6249:100-480(-)
MRVREIGGSESWDGRTAVSLLVALRAYRRISCLHRHISASSIGHGTVDSAGGSSLVSPGALIPMPGTFENFQWQRTLTAQGSRGMQVLNEWMVFFHQSGPAVSKALRRFLVLSSHLSEPPSYHPLD